MIDEYTSKKNYKWQKAVNKIKTATNEKETKCGNNKKIGQHKNSNHWTWHWHFSLLFFFFFPFVKSILNETQRRQFYLKLKFFSIFFLSFSLFVYFYYFGKMCKFRCPIKTSTQNPMKTCNMLCVYFVEFYFFFFGRFNFVHVRQKKVCFKCLPFDKADMSLFCTSWIDNQSNCYDDDAKWLKFSKAQANIVWPFRLKRSRQSRLHSNNCRFFVDSAVSFVWFSVCFWSLVVIKWHIKLNETKQTEKHNW